MFVKRDDLTPLAGGGNKIRKLGPICAAALAGGADVLVTGGGPQSNHVRATAAAARHLGLDAVAVLTGEAPDRASGNLTVDALLGVSFVWTGAASLVEVEIAIAEVTARLRDQGRRPYPITVGGADPIGSQGYVAAARELQEQLPTVDLVVVADGSGGTHAGLSAGFGTHDRVLGVSVGAFDDIEARVERLAVATARSVDLPDPSGVPLVSARFSPSGYGAEVDEAREAMHLAARTEGLILDPVYTGKALAALRAGLTDGTVGADRTIVFLHTGGAYGLLSERYADWAAGPIV